MFSNLWRMLISTGPFGKLILLVLLALSGYSWAIIITKWRRFRYLQRVSKTILKMIGSHRGVEILRLNIPSRDHPITKVITAVRQEIGSGAVASSATLREFDINPLFEAINERADAAVEEALEFEERNVDILAMTASVAPFLGLLGTVWGITVSFWEIGQQSSANIAIVAPGLAEALITTIAGLLVAIPAVIAFSIFNARLRAIASEVSGFTKKLVVQLKREMAHDIAMRNQIQ
jgi:biopolymer transport protein TolQ